MDDLNSKLAEISISFTAKPKMGSPYQIRIFDQTYVSPKVFWFTHRMVFKLSPECCLEPIDLVEYGLTLSVTFRRSHRVLWNDFIQKSKSFFEEIWWGAPIKKDFCVLNKIISNHPMGPSKRHRRFSSIPYNVYRF